jgi:hypothetical protein
MAAGKPADLDEAGEPRIALGARRPRGDNQELLGDTLGDDARRQRVLRRVVRPDGGVDPSRRYIWRRASSPAEPPT